MMIQSVFPKSFALPHAPVWLNIIGFQAGWLACIWGTATGHSGFAVSFAFLVAGAHLARAARPRGELRLLATAAAAGTAWDSLLMAGGQLEFRPAGLGGLIAPAWITAFWTVFATTFNIALRGLRDQPWLASLLGATLGPLVYILACRVGALNFPNPAIGVGLVGLGWMVLMPALVELAKRWDGISSQTPAALDSTPAPVTAEITPAPNSSGLRAGDRAPAQSPFSPGVDPEARRVSQPVA